MPRIFGVVAILCLSAGAPVTVQDDRAQATASWELAVAAKGGRDRLTAIHSFAIQERTVFARPIATAASGKIDQIACKLPEGWWEFLDYRPGRMGYSVSVVNAETGSGWASHDGAAAAPFLRPDTSTGFRMRLLQLVYFLETGAVHPIPLRTTRVRLGAKAVDRVAVQVDGTAADVYVDATTHLPIRVEAVRTTTLEPAHREARAPSPQSFVQDLESYREVAGIRVPSVIVRGNDRADVRIEINPEYDPAIFTRPPPAGAGIDDWRKATGRGLHVPLCR